MSRRTAIFFLGLAVSVSVPLTLSTSSAAQTGAEPAAKPAKKRPKLKPALPKPAPLAPEPVESAPASSPEQPKSETGAKDAQAPVASASSSPQPSVDAISCPQDKIDALVHDLTEWSGALEESERRLRVERGCGQPNVICLNRLGEPGSDPLPERVMAGRPISVYVVVPSIDRGRITISTSIRANTAQSQVADSVEATSRPAAAPASSEPCRLMSSQKDAIKAAAMPIARFGGQPGLEAEGVPVDSWTDSYWTSADDAKILGEWSTWQAEGRLTPRFTALRARMEVPTGDVLSVDFTRVERGSRSPSIEKHYDVVIDNGRYYVEPALLVPFIYKGSRSIELTPTVSGTELRVGIQQDWRVTGAAMINVFPLGRQKGQVSSFRYCRYRSCVDNWLGAQFGAGLDPLFRDWYLGIVLEPISGFTVGFGASLLKGEFLAPGRAEGMLLPTGDALVKYSDYMVRPYFGLSLTLDILETLDRGATATKRMLF